MAPGLLPITPSEGTGPSGENRSGSDDAKSLGVNEVQESIGIDTSSAFMSDALLSSGTGRPAPAWFAVWTRSRHEAVVAEQLTRKGIEAFLPTLPRWSRWKDRRKRIDWPLFPGYCFARIDPVNSLAVRSCSGVVMLVSTDGRPAPIPDSEIDSVRQLVMSDLQYDPCPLINEGDLVEVIAGPLRGVVGRLVRKGSHARLTLSVDLIGQGVSVEVDAADVRPY
jgi:transcriptional antiterminator NusG